MGTKSHLLVNFSFLFLCSLFHCLLFVSCYPILAVVAILSSCIMLSLVELFIFSTEHFMTELPRQSSTCLLRKTTSSMSTTRYRTATSALGWPGNLTKTHRKFREARFLANICESHTYGPWRSCVIVCNGCLQMVDVQY